MNRHFLRVAACGILTGDFATGGQHVQFAGIDHISHYLIPYGATFNDTAGETVLIHSISGITIAPASLSLLAVCDRSEIFSADFEFDVRSLGLVGISFRDRWNIRREDQQDTNFDGEDIATLANGGVLVVHENAQVYKLPPRRAWNQSGNIWGKPLAALPDYILEGLTSDSGFESLTVVDQDPQRVIVGTEGPLRQDHSSLRRLIELDVASGQVLCQKVIAIPDNKPTLYLTALFAIDSLGLLGGGQFLALWRGFEHEMGNEVRLYLLDTARADNVNHCSAIVNTSEPTCVMQNLAMVQMELVFVWTKDQPLGGRVHVDNYEGLVVVPSRAFGSESAEVIGGLMVLLINDNNNNPSQVGTQFVLLRLKFAETRAASHSGISITVTVAVAVVAAFAVAGFVGLGWYCRTESERTHKYTKDPFEWAHPPSSST
eukprot:TRINITY_DN16278_c0_g1_i2.p1 TRINITY_DN16278_c0_g1~~TRINITY_DN16278_c0_g1_i2.p1  ORF type:complete len:431 (-),score=37.87 TRINITY_DN16278_c0_g1_i2:114-1406(-)